MDSFKSNHRPLVHSQLGTGIAPKQTEQCSVETEQFRLELLPECANFLTY